MNKHLKRILCDVVGVIFIVVGIAGLFLPFLQGVLFLIIGLYLLSLHSPWVHKHFHTLKNKHSTFAELFERIDAPIRRFLKID